MTDTFAKLREVRIRTERKPEPSRIQPTFVPVYPDDIDWVKPQEWQCQNGHSIFASVHVISAMLMCGKCKERK